MSEVLIYKLLEAGFALWDIGMAREEIVQAAKAKQDAGATPDEVVAYIIGMRNDARAAAHAAIAAKHGL